MCWAMSARWKARSGTSWLSSQREQILRDPDPGPAKRAGRGRGQRDRRIPSKAGGTEIGGRDPGSIWKRRSTSWPKQPYVSAEASVIRQLSGRVPGTALEYIYEGASECGRRPAKVLDRGSLRPGKGERADFGDHRRPADESGGEGADHLSGQALRAWVRPPSPCPLPRR